MAARNSLSLGNSGARHSLLSSLPLDSGGRSGQPPAPYVLAHLTLLTRRVRSPEIAPIPETFVAGRKPTCRSAALWVSSLAGASALVLNEPSCYHVRVFDPRLPLRILQHLSRLIALQLTSAHEFEQEISAASCGPLFAGHCLDAHSWLACHHASDARCAEAISATPAPLGRRLGLGNSSRDPSA